MSNIKNKIKVLLDNSEIEIKPKWHFIIKTYLIVLSLIAIVLILSFISSFILYFKSSLNLYQAIDVLSDLYIMPWIIFFILFFILMTLLLFSRSINFVYKIPTIFLILIIIICISALSVTINKYNMHDKIFNEISKRDYKYLKKMYSGNKKSKSERTFKNNIKIKKDF